jgi:hypothetical protein
MKLELIHRKRTTRVELSEKNFLEMSLFQFYRYNITRYLVVFDFSFFICLLLWFSVCLLSVCRCHCLSLSLSLFSFKTLLLKTF